MDISCGDIYAPFWATRRDHAPTLGSRLISHELEKYGSIVPVPKTGNIVKAYVVVRGVYDIPSDYTFSLQSVVNGIPSDSGLQESFSLSTTDVGKWIGISLSSPLSVRRGEQKLAAVLSPPESPFTGSVAWQGFKDSSVGLPYALFYNGESWERLADHCPSLLLEYDDGEIAKIPNIVPWSDIGFLSGIYVDSLMPYHATSFVPAADLEISGFWCVCKMNNVDIEISLRDENSEILGTATIRKNHTGDVGGFDAQYAGLFGESISVSADVLYRLIVRNPYPSGDFRSLQLYYLQIAPKELVSRVWRHIPYSGFFNTIFRSETSDLSADWTDYEGDFLCLAPIIRRIV